MPFVDPELASPLPPDFTAAPGQWSIEEKYDGHRLIVAVGDSTPKRDLFEDDAASVRAWSRDKRDRLLPGHVKDALSRLPPGVYDGELLVPGQRSYGVTVVEAADQLRYVLFDVLHLLGRDLTAQGPVKPTYEQRRAMLLEVGTKLDCVFLEQGDPMTSEHPIRLAWSCPVTSSGCIDSRRDHVWKRDGEGLILKRNNSLYWPKKRTKDWLKVKKLQSAVLTIIGFTAGTMGQHSVIILQDDDGNQTSVKWKNLEILRQIEANPRSFLNRKLRIEFQERTPDGGYRHPRWDHLVC